MAGLFTAPGFAKGLSRREFLQKSTALSALAAAGLSKPVFAHNRHQAAGADVTAAFKAHTPDKVTFSEEQQADIEQVQLILFPADGDGPSAADLHAFDYLRWALTEPTNRDDGDYDFIIRGLGWLNDLAKTDYQQGFRLLSQVDKEALIKKISRSESGEKWLSLLLYYLLESLTLDPLYGGNHDGIGWQWLEHQPGYPRPDLTTHFRLFSQHADSEQS